MPEGTWRFDDSVAALDGKRMHVLIEKDGQRNWTERWRPIQQVEEAEFTLDLESFHEGCGFSFDDISFAYEYAHQFDATAVGRLRTWALDTTTIEAWTVANNEKGWMEFFGGYLYAIGSNISKKFDPADWSVDDTEDFAGGDARVVCGRPGRLNGKLYLPIRDSDDDTLEVFQELTTVATAPTADTWTAGPASKTARSFTNAQQDRLGKMWRATDEPEKIASVATAPTTETNWSDHGTDGYVAGVPGERVTDMVTFDRYILCAMNNGLHSFDETLYYVNEIPGISHYFDNINGVGIENWQDRKGSCLVMPHRQTDFRWASGTKRPIGPAQEGGLETTLSPDVQGRTWGQVQVFPWLFQFKEDEQDDDGYVVGLHPGYGRRETPPHCFFRTVDGRFDSGTPVYDAASDTMYLAIQRANTAGTSRTVYLAELPRGTIHPAEDERVNHAVSDAVFSTVRYTNGNRNVEKMWERVELYADLSPEADTPGLEVWASIEDGSAFQLEDGAGAAKTVLTSGHHVFYFPADSSSVGRWCRLEFRVPALGEGESAVDVTLRNIKLHGTNAPTMARYVETAFVLGSGEFADSTSGSRTVEGQRDLLVALSKPTAAPVEILDPWGGRYYARLENLTLREAIYKGYTHPILVAACRLRETTYG